MIIGERILLLLSREPDSQDYFEKGRTVTIDNSLDLLKRVFPDFSTLVSGKRIIDFGCGAGYQGIALAQRYDCSVVGIDTNKKILRQAIDNAKQHGIPPSQISFVASIQPHMRNAFDVVISQNSFEHFSNPRDILAQMKSLLNPSGLILLTFGPPWFAPYGSHMHFFCKVPWINILFSEKTVMRVRSRYRNDGAKKYHEVESGLNRMTIKKFESIVASSGLKTRYRNYECIKGINSLSRLPLLRELCINHVTVILEL